MPDTINNLPVLNVNTTAPETPYIITINSDDDQTCNGSFICVVSNLLGLLAAIIVFMDIHLAIRIVGLLCSAISIWFYGSFGVTVGIIAGSTIRMI